MNAFVHRRELFKSSVNVQVAKTFASLLNLALICICRGAMIEERNLLKQPDPAALTLDEISRCSPCQAEQVRTWFGACEHLCCDSSSLPWALNPSLKDDLHRWYVISTAGLTPAVVSGGLGAGFWILPLACSMGQLSLIFFFLPETHRFCLLQAQAGNWSVHSRGWKELGNSSL